MNKEAYTYCIYCGQPGTAQFPLELHHVILRSQGGTEGPQIPLCRKCHDRRHNEELRIEMRGDRVVFAERETGEITIRGLVPQVAVGPSNLVDQARAIATWMQTMAFTQALEEESDEHLAALYDEIRSIKHRAWMLQAAIIATMQARSSYGDHMAEHVAKALGCNARTVQSRGQIYREIIANPEAAEAVELIPEEGFYKEAVSADIGAIAAINLAKERKIENSRYSVAQFRQEIRAPGETSTLRRIVLICADRGIVDERIAAEIERRYSVPVELIEESGAKGAGNPVIRLSDRYPRAPHVGADLAEKPPAQMVVEHVAFPL